MGELACGYIGRMPQDARRKQTNDLNFCIPMFVGHFTLKPFGLMYLEGKIKKMYPGDGKGAGSTGVGNQ